jgi:hypothetical protein
MKIRNIHCGVVATAAFLAAAWGFPGTSAGGHGSENLAPVQAGSDAPPTPAQAMAIFNQIDSWVRQWAVPRHAELPPVTAASVTLRLHGGILGRGSAVAMEPGGEPQVILTAARQALEQAAARVPIERDALFEESLRQVAPSIVLSVELAGPLIPFSPREYAEVTMDLAPGLEGVAARIGQRIDALFPATMLANATEPGAALSAIVSRLTDDPTLGLQRPAQLAEEHQAVFYRFRTAHLAQTRGAGTPVFLHRGGSLVERRNLDSINLRHWADAMADHLTQRLSAGAEQLGIIGTYNPVTGVADPALAGPGEQALAALALIQYSEMCETTSQRGVHMRDAAERLLRDLARRQPGELDPLNSPAATAAAWVALRTLSIERPSSASESLRSDPAELVEFFERLSAQMDLWEEDISMVPAEQRGVALWALARHAAETRKTRPAVQGAVRSLYRETPPGQLATHMPWLGWAELTLARLETAPGVRADVPAAIALRDLRDQVWSHQLASEGLAWENRDMAGGIIFTAGRNPLPTWHSARPLAFIATMLGDDRLTSDAEVAGELSRLLDSLRFLRQLTAGEAEGHMYRTPQRALGGVRASLWDQRMPPEATALTLLTVCEALGSMAAISERRRDAAGQDGR